MGQGVEAAQQDGQRWIGVGSTPHRRCRTSWTHGSGSASCRLGCRSPLGRTRRPGGPRQCGMHPPPAIPHPLGAHAPLCQFSQEAYGWPQADQVQTGTQGGGGAQGLPLRRSEDLHLGCQPHPGPTHNYSPTPTRGRQSTTEKLRHSLHPCHSPGPLQDLGPINNNAGNHGGH